MTAFLEARNLVRHFPTAGGKVVKAVDGVSLTIAKGETLGLVGESGCGKSTTGRLLMRLQPLTSGELEFDGKDIASLSSRALRPMRRRMQMVFQDPFASLDPRMTVAQTLDEMLVIHKLGTKAERRDRVAWLMEKVGLRPDQLSRYPHEFSGGQRQRIAIARALATGPDLIVADEPVSALDLSIQAQIINLLSDLRAEFGLSFLMISHDLSVVKHVSDRVAVMYLGRIVETGPVEQIYAAPRHPYTQVLLGAAPRIDPKARRERMRLTGDIPSPIAPPPGCAFHPRCPRASEICRSVRPELALSSLTGRLPEPAADAGHQVACHHPIAD